MKWSRIQKLITSGIQNHIYAIIFKETFKNRVTAKYSKAKWCLNLYNSNSKVAVDEFGEKDKEGGLEDMKNLYDRKSFKPVE